MKKKLIISVLLAVNHTQSFTHRRNTLKTSNTSLSSTWSNGQAIEEYFDLLASGKSEPDQYEDCPSVIAKIPHTDDFKLPEAIYTLGSGNDIILVPNEPLPSDMDCPIYMCVPPQLLHDTLINLNEEWMSKTDDMVFFSGGVCGNIEHVLKYFALARDKTTQVVIGGLNIPQNVGYMPSDKSISFGTDAQGEMKWSGECGACGKWQGAIAQRLQSRNIRCRTGFYREFRRWMWEQSAYDAVFNLVGAVRTDRTTHKDSALYYEEEVSDMLWEVSSVLRGYLAITMTYGFEERLFELAERQGQENECVLKDDMFSLTFPYPFDQSQMICEYLAYGKLDVGLFSTIELDPKILEKKPDSVMRQGNLRADGVL